MTTEVENTPINLSRFGRPKVPGVLLTQAQLFEIARADLIARGQAVGDTAADPAHRLTQGIALAGSTYRQAIYDLSLGNTIAYATGNALVVLALNYPNTVRKENEPDDTFRVRIASSNESLARGLSGGYYEQLSKAVESVFDARFNSPAPGEVVCSILADESKLKADGSVMYPDGIPDAALLAAVTAVITAPDARQQTDDVSVTAAVNLDYSIDATLLVYAGPDTTLAVSKALAELTALVQLRRRLGETISKAVVAEAVINAGVRDATIILRPITGYAADGTPTAYGNDTSVITATASQALRGARLNVAAA